MYKSYIITVILFSIFIAKINADCCVGATTSVLGDSVSDCDPYLKDNFFLNYKCNGFSGSADGIISGQICDSCSTNITSGGIALVVVVPIVILLICFIGCYHCCCKKRKSHHHGPQIHVVHAQTQPLLGQPQPYGQAYGQPYVQQPTY